MAADASGVAEGTPAPLEGVRVLDLSSLLPGPACSLLLAQLGASVVAVERPSGDPIRTLAPGMYELLHERKATIVVDLTDARGQAVVRAAVPHVDVVLEAYRPGVAERLGCGYEALSALNPDLVYCSISGYGQAGRDRDVTGHDLNYIARAGWLSLSGAPGGPPVSQLGAPIADLGSSLVAALSVVAAVAGARAGQGGRYVDVAMVDAALWLGMTRLAELVAYGSSEGLRAALQRPGYGVFETRDGRYVTIAAIEDHFWVALCRVLGLDDLAVDERWGTHAARRPAAAALNAEVARAVRGHDLDDLLASLEAASVPASPVVPMERVPFDEGLAARGTVVRAGRFDTVGYPARLTGVAADGAGMPAPEQAAEVLARWGFTEAEIADLRRDGVVGTPRTGPFERPTVPKYH